MQLGHLFRSATSGASLQLELDDLGELEALASAGKVKNYETWLNELIGKPTGGVSAAAPWAAEARATANARPVDMKQPWGIDFDTWKSRLQSKGVTGDIDSVIQRAKGAGHDALAARGELRSFERAADRGAQVEIVTPPAGKGAAQGQLSAEAKLTQGGQQRAYEAKTATEPPDRKTWNAHADKANKQIKASGNPGDISFDWTEVDLAKSDFPSAGEIEAFLNGKMTKDRLKEVKYFEIVWKDDKGTLWVTSRTRAPDGTVGPVTTVKK